MRVSTQFTKLPLQSPLIPLGVMVALLLLRFMGALVGPLETVAHDSYKPYPFFHFFIQNLQNGTYPLWSPFTHSGEPFWPYLQVLGLLHPIVSVLAVVSVIGNIENIALLFNWYIVLSILVFNISLYVLISKLIPKRKNVVLLWFIAPIIFWGSFTSSAWFGIFGSVIIATYFPLCLLFLWNFLTSAASRNHSKSILWALGLGFLVSVHLNSGNPVYFVLSFILSLVSLVFIFKNRYPKTYSHLWNKKNLSLGVLSISIATVFSLFAITMAAKQSQFVPIGRIDSNTQFTTQAQFKGLLADSEQISGDIGTVAQWEDLYQSILPLSNPFSNYLNFNPSSFAFLFGIFGFVFLLIGLSHYQHPLYFPSTVPLIVLSLISVGARGGLSPLLYQWVPGFSAIRHTVFFLSFAYVFACIVTCIGISAFLKVYFKHVSQYSRVGLIILFVMLVGVFWGVKRNHFRTTKQQMTPLVMLKQFPYHGDKFNLTRQYKTPSFNSFLWMRDASKSQGEPLLLYSDSVRFTDNGSQFMMKKNYWEFLNEPITSPHRFLANGHSKFQLLQTKGQSKDIVPLIINFSANHLHFVIESPTQANLFLSQTFDMDWKVSLNQQSLDLKSHEEHAFYEFPINQGIQSIEMTYKPTLIQVGLTLTYLGQFVFLVTAIYYLLFWMNHQFYLLRSYLICLLKRLSKRVWELPWGSSSHSN